MPVIVDTNIWSLVLRRKSGSLSAAETKIVASFRELALSDDILLLGIVRQEVLSGIRSDLQFEQVRTALRRWPDEPLTIEDHEEASRCNNLFRADGIATSAVDCLICGVSLRRAVDIFTLDADFSRYKGVVPISLYSHL